jgi:hypothetical protein
MSQHEQKNRRHRADQHRPTHDKERTTMTTPNEEHAQRPGAGAAILIPDRAQAIKDGYLVELMSVAAKQDHPIPVAFTRAAVFDLLAWDQDEQDEHGLSEESRQAISNQRLSKAAGVCCAAFDEWAASGKPEQMSVATLVTRRAFQHGAPQPEPAMLVAEFHPDETGQSVVTISRLGECGEYTEQTSGTGKEEQA